MGNQRGYHIERARAELDAAYRAAPPQATEAHLRFCSMHMSRAKALLEAERAPEIDWIERCRPLHRRSLVPAG